MPFPLSETTLVFDSAVREILHPHALELIEPKLALKGFVLSKFDKLREVEVFRFKIHLLGHVPKLRRVEGSVAMPHRFHDLSLIKQSVRIVNHIRAIL